MVDQINAALGTNTAATSPVAGTSAAKPYADLGSIGHDATQFGSARAMPEKDDGSIIGKILGLGTAVAGIAALARFGRARALLGRIPGKDKIIKMIGDAAIKFRGSSLGKPLLTRLRKIPVVGEPFRRAYANLMKAGRTAGKRLAESAAKAGEEIVEGTAKAVA